jgi:eukaryotic-like serine/threonine-protein kinase
LGNDYGRELLIRLERTIPLKDVFTAASASSVPLFRELFPGEILRRGQLMNVATVTLVAASLGDPAKLCDDFGDAQAYEVLQNFYRVCQDLMKRHKGVVVKQVDDRILAAFDDCETALNAAVSLAETSVRCDEIRENVPRIGVHRGAALATTLHNQLDYFGTSVNRAFRLLKDAGPGEVVLSQEISADLSVHALVKSRNLSTETVCAAGFQSRDEIVQRIRVRTGPAAAAVTGQTRK